MNKDSSDISSLVYAPYSSRQESCYIAGKSGCCYPGVRVENISFPLTIPAVQAAVCSCLANQDEPVSIIQQNTNSQFSDSWINKFKLTERDTFPDDSSVYDPLIKEVEDIKASLKKLCDLSVADHSNFPVTALLKTDKGFIPGVNVEFDEWNLGLCAERVAISRALAAGYSNFLEMHIYAPKTEYISPCGACRQVLFELMPDQMIKLYHNDHSVSAHFISHLLPNGFTSSSLRK